MMKPIVFALVAFCAAVTAARAQEADVPPLGPAAQVAAAAQERQAEARAFAERRSRMIEECEDHHGYEADYVREVDTELRAEGLQAGGRVIHLRAPR